jgi:c-di-GMP-binding flagellar brake protein YcgR
MKNVKVKDSSTNMINLWERLELKLEDGKEVSIFITRIEDIDGDRLVVECPVRIKGKLPLAVGQTLEAFFNRHDAAYVFKVVVAAIDSQKENMTTLQLMSGLSRTQRRKFVRIDISGNIAFRALGTNEQGQVLLESEKKGELLNISAGGILIASAEKLKQGDYLLMNFRLKNSHRLENILGLVKRVDEQENEYLIGVEFLTKEQSSESLPADVAEFLPPDTGYFDDELQKLIIQFVYKQQVKLRKEEKSKRNP